VSNNPNTVNDVGKLTHKHAGAADAHTVAAFRQRFRDWLNRHLELGSERFSDIVLSTDEALTNCADHAYLAAECTGDMTLQATYHPITTELEVCVTDHGRWIEPDPAAINAIRGRGILLMRALTDDCTIEGTNDSTTVCLHFRNCPPKHRVSPVR
jgi:serine/threonine-protein kinase RsbW